MIKFTLLVIVLYVAKFSRVMEWVADSQENHSYLFNKNTLIKGSAKHIKQYF